MECNASIFMCVQLQKDTRSESEAEVDDTSSDSTTVVTWRSVSNGNAKPRSQLSSNHLK